MPGYAVIDLETTGFSPAKHHRVVEIGVVRVSPTGAIEGEWSTLVNPGRDIGNSHVHGITATDIVSAPAFRDIAPFLVGDLVGRTVVAHNAAFDLPFLEAELQRAGIRLEQLPLRGLCTMQWSSVFLESPSRRLVDCCSSCGIQLNGAHSALGDARATAQLLGHYLSLLDGAPRLPWQEDIDQSHVYPWPTITAHASAPLLERDAARSARPDTWLDRIIARMPRTADVRVDSYLATLERALIDGVLAEHEKDELIEVASGLGLTRTQVLDLHSTYLVAMAQVALADHIVTPQERDDLDRVALMLGLQPSDVETALATAQQGPAAAALVESATIALEPGDRVVFTGAMKRDRASWEEFARSRGWVPGSVTKKTRLVVASDPNSQSGKAAKARSYGIPIVTEEAFARLVGEEVPR